MSTSVHEAKQRHSGFRCFDADGLAGHLKFVGCTNLKRPNAKSSRFKVMLEAAHEAKQRIQASVGSDQTGLQLTPNFVGCTNL